MPIASYKVVKATPGNIRIQIQELRHDVEFATRLRALITAWAPATETRVYPMTASIAVIYSEKGLSEAQIEKHLAMAIEQAADPSFKISMDGDFLGYGFQGLTAYEYLQVQEIMKWSQEPLSIASNLAGKVLAPIQKAVDALVTDSFLRKAKSLMESATENWHRDWKTFQKQAKTGDLDQLKKMPLEHCDHLVKSVRSRALGIAAVQGFASGIVGMAGAVVSADLFIRGSVQAIHRTGFCYGYAPQTELERQYAWAILAVATASTTQEREKALSRLNDHHRVLYQQIIGDLAEERVVVEVEELTIETALRGMLSRIVKLEGEEEIPGIGIVTGIYDAHATIEKASTAAHRSFQLRWLLENQCKPS